MKKNFSISLLGGFIALSLSTASLGLNKTLTLSQSVLKASVSSISLNLHDYDSTTTVVGDNQDYGQAGFVNFNVDLGTQIDNKDLDKAQSMCEQLISALNTENNSRFLKKLAVKTTKVETDNNGHMKQPYNNTSFNCVVSFAHYSTYLENDGDKYKYHFQNNWFQSGGLHVRNMLDVSGTWNHQYKGVQYKIQPQKDVYVNIYKDGKFIDSDSLYEKMFYLNATVQTNKPGDYYTIYASDNTNNTTRDVQKLILDSDRNYKLPSQNPNSDLLYSDLYKEGAWSYFPVSKVWVYQAAYLRDPKNLKYFSIDQNIKPTVKEVTDLVY